MTRSAVLGGILLSLTEFGNDYFLGLAVSVPNATVR